MLGILLLVLPGQGILTILVGLSVLDLPFKRRLVRSLLHFPRVRAALQAHRRSAGRAPLILPPARPRDAMARLRRKRSARNTGGDHRTL